MRAWICIALLALACGKDGGGGKQDQPAPPKPAIDEPELEPTPVEPEPPKPEPPKPEPPKPEAPKPEPPKPDADACIKECVQRNQMKATSPEIIESDCRAECRATK